jgi:hypothetical protein
MSFVDFKEVNINNPGTSTRYGSNDILDIMQILNGKVVSNRQVRVKNVWQFIDHIEIKAPVSLPGSPTDATIRYLVVDPADNHLKIMKSGGAKIDLESLISNVWNASNTETITNKTIQVDQNTVNHSSTNNAGDILKNNGTKFNRFGRGAALQLLRTNAAGSDLEWADPSLVAGGGETNTASNVGTSGIGVFKTKSGVDLQFKKLFAASSNISVVDDVANSKINLDVNLAGISLGSIGGTLNVGSQVTGTMAVANGGTGVASLTGLVKASGTLPFSAITNGVSGTVLTMVGGTPQWAALPTSTSATAFMPDVTKYGGFWGGAVDGTGMLAGAQGYGATFTGDQSSSTDNFTTFTTDNSDGATAGFKSVVTITRRSYNPVMNFRFKVGNTSNSRVWIGLNTESFMDTNSGGDAPLDNGRSGMLFGYGSSDATWQLDYNSGNASSSTLNTGVTKNTSVHDLQLEFDNTASKVKATLDGSVFTPAGTGGTPGTTTPLFLHFNIEAIGANAVPISLNYAKIVATD